MNQSMTPKYRLLTPAEPESYHPAKAVWQRDLDVFAEPPFGHAFSWPGFAPPQSMQESNY